MIEYKTKDITTVEHGIIAHGVNCQRRMGSGVALAIRRQWPDAYIAYMLATPFLGTICWARINDQISVANCYTQHGYGYARRKYADEHAIESCFEALFSVAQERRLTVYLPRIGCGLGGLHWESNVEPLLRPYSRTHHVVVCDWK